MKDKDTKIVGNVTELEILTYVTKLGYQVSIPFGDRSRYDQIWDINGKLYKIQIKTSHLNENGDIIVPCKSSNRKNGKTINRRYTSDEIDFISTYFNGKCYLIPVQELPSREKTLRFENPKNNQLKNINWASDYEIEKIISNL